jgi:lipoprotein-releasing system permease protein
MIFFSSYELLLIKRFLFSKKTDGFISIFSWFSVVGITIGVAAIIIVMAVMNGFREELTSRMLGINGHLNIYSPTEEITRKDFEIFIKNQSNDYVVPFSQSQALIISENSSRGVILRGYDNKFIKDNHFLNKKIIKGSIFLDRINDVVVGYALANQLGLKINDRIKIAIPKTDKTIFGEIPRFKTLKIVGIFNLGMFEYDSNFIFTHVEIANKLLLIDYDNFSQLEIFTTNPDLIEDTQLRIDNIIKKNKLNLYTASWKENNATLINALKVEKNVMFLILTLIIIVASMNIISGLVIFVKEKNKDIGILKTIGIKDKSLIKIFLSIGLIIGLLGTFLGTFIGIIFCINIKYIQSFLEKILKTDLFAKEIYYLSNLPAKIDNFELISVIAISIFICLIATSFPAYRSIKIDPIKSLKIE